jgi:hypothetical protein
MVDPTAALSEERTLAELPELAELRRRVEEQLEAADLLGAAEISSEPHSLRIAFATHESVCAALEALERTVADFPGNLVMSRGSYAGNDSLDIAPIHKADALDVVATLLGLETDAILRIGDHGEEQGNDASLLDHVTGFSVGDGVSASAGTCHLVLGSAFERLLGVDATRRLLDTALILAPLSIAPNPPDDAVRALRQFNRLAVIAARGEERTALSRVRLRLNFLLSGPARRQTPHRDIQLDDIFDPLSGAVRLRDWELDEINASSRLSDLFTLDDLRVPADPPGSRRSMFSDTGVLLRGPDYYFARAASAEERSFPRFCVTETEFVASALASLDSLLEGPATLVKYKLALAIHDNVRNGLLQLLFAAYVSETEAGQVAFDSTRHIYAKGVAAHTAAHYDFLLNADREWGASVGSYRGVLTNILALWEEAAVTELSPPAAVFKYREADNFLEAIAAVQLGLQKLREHNLSSSPDVMALGIAYGGLELPAIAAVVAEARGFNVVPALTRVSLYSDEEARDEIRAGTAAYIRRLAASGSPVCVVAEEGDTPDMPVVIFDDNCTTGATLQTTRDMLSLLGRDVVGAVIVSFPSANRHVQMGMPNHGFADPQALFNFIRGLVSPTPFSRLLVPGSSPHEYLDQPFNAGGVFDKGKARVDRYLKKNGTLA